MIVKVTSNPRNSRLIEKLIGNTYKIINVSKGMHYEEYYYGLDFWEYLYKDEFTIINPKEITIF